MAKYSWGGQSECEPEYFALWQVKFSISNSPAEVKGLAIHHLDINSSKGKLRQQWIHLYINDGLAALSIQENTGDKDSGLRSYNAQTPHRHWSYCYL